MLQKCCCVETYQDHSGYRGKYISEIVANMFRETKEQVYSK